MLGGSVIKLFVDDTKDPFIGFEVMRDPVEAMTYIKDNIKTISVLSLDHDFGSVPVTGEDLVRFLVEDKLYPPVILIHSLNIVGRLNMLNLLKLAKCTSNIALVNYSKSMKTGRIITI